MVKQLQDAGWTHDQAITTMKEVRKQRNPQAHKLSVDVFDLELFKAQIKLMRDAYRAMVTLRQMLKFHPAATDYEVPDYLERQEVWDF